MSAVSSTSSSPTTMEVFVTQDRLTDLKQHTFFNKVITQETLQATDYFVDGDAMPTGPEQCGYAKIRIRMDGQDSDFNTYLKTHRSDWATGKLILDMQEGHPSVPKAPVDVFLSLSTASAIQNYKPLYDLLSHELFTPLQLNVDKLEPLGSGSDLQPVANVNGQPIYPFRFSLHKLTPEAAKKLQDTIKNFEAQLNPDQKAWLAFDWESWGMIKEELADIGRQAAKTKSVKDAIASGEKVAALSQQVASQTKFLNNVTGDAATIRGLKERLLVVQRLLNEKNVTEADRRYRQVESLIRHGKNDHQLVEHKPTAHLPIPQVHGIAALKELKDQAASLVDTLQDGKFWEVSDSVLHMLPGAYEGMKNGLQVATIAALSGAALAATAPAWVVAVAAGGSWLLIKGGEDLYLHHRSGRETLMEVPVNAAEGSMMGIPGASLVRGALAFGSLESLRAYMRGERDPKNIAVQGTVAAGTVGVVGAASRAAKPRSTRPAMKPEPKTNSEPAAALPRSQPQDSSTPTKAQPAPRTEPLPGGQPSSRPGASPSRGAAEPAARGINGKEPIGIPEKLVTEIQGRANRVAGEGARTLYAERTPEGKTRFYLQIGNKLYSLKDGQFRPANTSEIFPQLHPVQSQPVSARASGMPVLASTTAPKALPANAAGPAVSPSAAKPKSSTPTPTPPQKAVDVPAKSASSSAKQGVVPDSGRGDIPKLIQDLANSIRRSVDVYFLPNGTTYIQSYENGNLVHRLYNMGKMEVIRSAPPGTTRIPDKIVNPEVRVSPAFASP